MKPPVATLGVFVLAAVALAAPQSHITGSVCDEDERALHGQSVPGGGTLAIGAFPTGAVLGPTGRIAFYARVSGSLRNQGVFVADATGITSIARGSGGGLGTGVPGSAVGDPSPIGGRFTGFPSGGGNPPSFSGGLVIGDLIAPAINANGDVLFLADVQGGSAPRGLFLFRAATQSIVKVAANGDPLPGGGTLLGVGPGSLSSSGTVLFIGYGASNQDERILRWDNGVLAQVAQLGDPAPSFGNYAWFGFTGYGLADGTWMPVEPVPDVNDRGSICFVAYTSQLGMHGVVFDDGSGPQWYALVGQTVTPQGNAVGECSAAVLNEADEVAFYCSFWNGMFLVPGGWLVGRANVYREALLFNDSIGGDTVISLAVSANPVSPLSDDGDLVVWTELQTATGTQHALVLSRANGACDVIRRQGDASSAGGALGRLSYWPSINAIGHVTLSSELAGAPAGAQSAHALLTMCPVVQSYCTPGTTVHGCAATISGVGVPSASSSSNFTLSVTGVEGQRNGMVFYGISGPVAWPWAAGSTSWMCVKSPLQRTGLASSGGTSNACDGVLALDFNAFRAAHPSALGEPLAAGQALHAQGWFRDPGAAKNTSLSDALELWLAP